MSTAVLLFYQIFTFGPIFQSRSKVLDSNLLFLDGELNRAYVIDTDIQLSITSFDAFCAFSY